LNQKQLLKGSSKDQGVSQLDFLWFRDQGVSQLRDQGVSQLDFLWF